MAREITDELLSRLQGAGRGLCSENPADYMAAGVSAQDALDAAAEIVRLRAALTAALAARKPAVAPQLAEALREAADSLSSRPKELRGPFALAARPAQEPFCTLGVGCDETGICYAMAHDQPERCGRAAPLAARQAQEPVAWRYYWKGRWHFTEHLIPEGEVQPLYAAPLAAQPGREELDALDALRAENERLRAALKLAEVDLVHLLVDREHPVADDPTLQAIRAAQVQP